MNSTKKAKFTITNQKVFFVILLITSTLMLTGFLLAKDKRTKLLLETNYGKITIELYNETPLHRNNSIALVEKHYYDSLLFHRVINGFMIQCGDPDSKGAPAKKMLGMGSPGYTIPAEFVPGLIHKKGAIAAARFGDEQNPLKASSGSQFYIVQGRTYSDDELNTIEKQRLDKKTFIAIRDFLLKPENDSLRNVIILLQKDRKVEEYDAMIESVKLMIPNEISEIQKYKYTQEQREIYKTIGGSPHLDYEYTVFGEVVDGIEVVDKIAAVETKNERPKIDVIMKLRVLK